MARKKKKGARRYNPNAPGNGRKFGATMKKQGPLSGPGIFLAKKTGIKGFKTVMPLVILLAATSAVAPAAAAAIAAPVAHVPVVGDIARLSFSAGTYVRSMAGGQR